MNTGIWWIRRDLRLADNEALTAVLRAHSALIPLFIIDPALLRSPYVGPKRLAFLWAGLRQLDADLRRRGSYLLVRQGQPANVLATVLNDTGATAVYAEADYSPYARQRDQAIQARLPLRLLPGVTVHPPDDVLRPDGQPYTVFTPFSKRWRQRPLPHPSAILPAPDHIPTPANIPGDNLPDLPTTDLFPAGEAEAQRRLRAFTQAAIYRYADERNRVDLNATSQLSPYLRFGMISARQTAVATQSAYETAANENGRAGATTFLNELIWREFYSAILYHFPHVRQGSFRREYDAIGWHNDPADFAAWQHGQTGFPIVDAAMRQLQQTGWLHNRARMIVASFLVKDLLIDWRWGERHFMAHLLDGDPAANNGGWQWTAGVGTDAAPYFRIFNPALQGVKFDPAGDYVRRWLPELTAVPDPYIHQPATMPLHVQQQCGVIIGQHYPHPIIDRALSRPRTLAAYQAVKEV
jgi:deoxyribodipyrimidine photo-lyase